MSNETGREITQSELDEAAKQEQELADQAVSQHINQRVAVLRAALNAVQADNASLREQLDEARGVVRGEVVD